MQKFTIPRVIYGTSGLGNLYTALSDDVKLSIVAESIRCSEKPAMFDSAGKYGAGLALETLGTCLRKLNVDPTEVIISNKLGWLQTALKTSEPTFEPGVWKNLKHDAIQKISYEGILECYHQGDQLLQGYKASMVSVHDPDEYIAAAADEKDAAARYQHILEAYVALEELKAKGEVQAIGIGSKDWRMIERISKDVKLDWVMIANSMTVHSHPEDLLNFMKKLKDQGIGIINSAVFNGGFLIGSDFYNYKPVNPQSRPDLYKWRESFFDLCSTFNLKLAAVCARFGIDAPGVVSIALNTTNPSRVEENVKMAYSDVPFAFWNAMKEHGLINQLYEN